MIPVSIPNFITHFESYPLTATHCNLLHHYNEGEDFIPRVQ